MKKLTLLTIGLSLIFSQAYAGDTYLSENEIPDPNYYIGNPPANNEDNLEFFSDIFAYRNGVANRTEENVKFAKFIAGVEQTDTFPAFNDAAGFEISKTNTPVLFAFLEKAVLKDVYMITKRAKKHFLRERPFAFFDEHSCAIEYEKILKKNESYPSGHTTRFWSTALLLAEIIPQKANEILKFGYDAGNSRVLCGCHWKSDVDAARNLSAASIAALHNNAEFMSDLQKSKEEVEKLLNKQQLN